MTNYNVFLFTEHRIIGCKILLTYNSRQHNTIVFSEDVFFSHKLTIQKIERQLVKVYAVVLYIFSSFFFFKPNSNSSHRVLLYLDKNPFITYITSKAKSFASQKSLIGVDSLLIEVFFS